uniref:Kelch-like protein diablo n=1 Tax=Glossina morsitans morsitans TaxID=37546 RepID=A0A1B0FGY4_GLOMM
MPQYYYLATRSVNRAHVCEAIDSEEPTVSSYSHVMLNSLNQLRLDQMHCDFILEAEGECIYAHKLLLVAASPYFGAMLQHNTKEKREGKVRFTDVEVSALKAIVDYVYTGAITITEDSVTSLLSTSNLLLIDAVKYNCEQFLKRRVNLTNCLNIRKIADLYYCVELLLYCNKCIAKWFPRLITVEEFLELSFEEFKAIIKDDDLYVQKEEYAYQSVLNWVKYNLEARQVYLPELLRHINLLLLRPEFLKSLIRTEPLFKHDLLCKDVFIEALFHFLPGQKRKRSLDVSEDTRRSQRRYGTPHVAFVGGANGDWQSLSTCRMYDISTARLFAMAPLAECRSGVSTVSLHECLYATGGHNAQITMKTAERYDPIINQWHHIAPMKNGHAFHGACAFKNQIYVIGGDRSSSFEYYNPTTNKWYDGPDTPSRYWWENRATVIGNSIYSLGDAENGIILNNRYDPREGLWHILDNTTYYVRQFGLAAYGHSLYCVGGWPWPNQCKRFDIRANRWESLAAMNVGRDRHATLIIENEIYVFGGWNQILVPTAERYNIAQNKWTTDRSIAIELFVGGAAIIRHRTI